MNDPANIKLDFDEMLDWLRRYREANSLSWPALAKRMNRPSGSVSTWQSPSFAGNRENVARTIYAFKQMVDSQEARAAIALDEVPFLETKTAERLQFLMEWAHGGRITAAAMGPGTGKSKTAEHYNASMGDTVFLVKMRPSTRTVSSMISQVMRAMGLSSPNGWVSQRSAQIEEFVRNRRALLIVDEANHLALEPIEEMRAWHDNAGLGICFLGNEELVERIRGGARRHAYARLNSRIAYFHIQDVPLEEDIRTFLDANNIDDPGMIRTLLQIGLSPAHGGLREIRQVLEAANMAAIMSEGVLDIAHINQAIASRTSDARRRAA
jgi:DNA transposition AAA+ family ATPase